MKLVGDNIFLDELRKMAAQMFGNMVKAVVDVEKKIMAVDGELHADEEALLIEKGSKQADLWGINIYPDLKAEERLEYDSMINIKPSLGNRTRGVDDLMVREKIMKIVNGMIRE